MYNADQDQEELEDDLYQEDETDTEESEVNSELEFQLYSQLHYSSNPGELQDAEEEDIQEQEVLGKHTDEERDLKDLKDSRPPSAPNANFQQLPKKKKAEKQKKRKSEPENQKSSSQFEEVIVIDSSPEVISITENESADDDVGICSLKAQSSHLLQTSTPAQQETQKRKRSTGVPVNLVSSSSDSDSEELDSASESDSSELSESPESSDSDGLENWMILGGGKHDEDQSILLNLEGEPDSNTDAEEVEGSWLVSNKDKEAQINNKDKGRRLTRQRMSNRYYTGKNVNCRNCDRTGHLSKNCPDPKKLSPCFLCGTNGHMASDCPNRHCNNCGLPGHLYNSCSERAYWHKQCNRCSMTGHYFDACPQIWRQYHITTKTGPPVKKQGQDMGQSPAFCFNCSQKGHFGHECTRQRMFKGVYPSIPFVSYYDLVGDIKSRQHRISLKVKVMRKNGYLPTPSQSPVTPGPPKKKQKISNDKNNHQLYHTSRKTSNDHNPTPSHIFFNDKFRDSTPKAKGLKRQDGVGSIKPWKPKRPVPTSKDPLPPTKLILDEAEDFPRGGGPEKNMKKKKKNKKKHVPLSLPEELVYTRPDQLLWTGNERKHGPSSKHQKGEMKKKKRKHPHRVANKKLDSQMYPTDENLFIIKQRKRSR